jgi:hypothetical protein
VSVPGKCHKDVADDQKTDGDRGRMHGGYNPGSSRLAV